MSPSTPARMTAPLSEQELDELDSFLLSDATSDETMMLDCLDGYLTAIVSGPVTLQPSDWLPGVWGPSSRDEPAYDTIEQAYRIFELIVRHKNGIEAALQDNPDTFEPVFDIAVYPDNPKEYVDGEMWAHGYMSGIDLVRNNWQPFLAHADSAAALRPIYLLGAAEVSDEEEKLCETSEQREELSRQIPASLASIYRFWSPYRQAAERAAAAEVPHEQPKVGRNDLCPCGSGRKFKKCCGSATH